MVSLSRNPTIIRHLTEALEVLSEAGTRYIAHSTYAVAGARGGRRSCRQTLLVLLGVEEGDSLGVSVHCFHCSDCLPVTSGYSRPFEDPKIRCVFIPMPPIYSQLLPITTTRREPPQPKCPIQVASTRSTISASSLKTCTVPVHTHLSSTSLTTSVLMPCLRRIHLSSSR